MLTDIAAVDHWLAHAKTGDTLFFVSTAASTGLARENPDFAKLYARLKEAQDKRLGLLKVGYACRAMARMIRHDEAFKR
jgi:hypothetical protein